MPSVRQIAPVAIVIGASVGLSASMIAAGEQPPPPRIIPPPTTTTTWSAPAPDAHEPAAEALLAAILVLRPPPPRPAPPAPLSRPRWSADWDGIARCETGSNWNMQGDTYSGGVGFANSTWDGFGGRQFASNAGAATKEQQIIVAERVYRRYGLSGWGCRAYG